MQHLFGRSGQQEPRTRQEFEQTPTRLYPCEAVRSQCQQNRIHADRSAKTQPRRQHCSNLQPTSGLCLSESDFAVCLSAQTKSEEEVSTKQTHICDVVGFWEMPFICAIKFGTFCCSCASESVRSAGVASSSSAVSSLFPLKAAASYRDNDVETDKQWDVCCVLCSRQSDTAFVTWSSGTLLAADVAAYLFWRYGVSAC